MTKHDPATLTLTVELPMEAFRHHPREPEQIAREMRLLWLLERVRERRLAAGKAAEIAGVSWAEFVVMMGRHRISPFDFDPEELVAELQPIG